MKRKTIERITDPVIVLGEVPVKNLTPGFSRRAIQNGAGIICVLLVLLTLISMVIAIIGVL